MLIAWGIKFLIFFSNNANIKIFQMFLEVKKGKKEKAYTRL